MYSLLELPCVVFGAVLLQFRRVVPSPGKLSGLWTVVTLWTRSSADAPLSVVPSKFSM